MNVCAVDQSVSMYTIQHHPHSIITIIIMGKSITSRACARHDLDLHKLRRHSHRHRSQQQQQQQRCLERGCWIRAG
jgi:hypothetical protein